MGYEVEGSVFLKCQVSGDHCQEDRPARHNKCAEVGESIEDDHNGVEHGGSFQRGLIFLISNRVKYDKAYNLCYRL